MGKKFLSRDKEDDNLRRVLNKEITKELFEMNFNYENPEKKL